MMLIQIDALPESVAVSVGQKALDNYPDKELVRTKLAKSTRPAVVALAGNVTPLDPAKTIPSTDTP